MVEVSVEARKGDSGGPILNARGELAGVLFGAGNGATTGSHIGRVKTFLDDAFIEQDRLARGLNFPQSDPTSAAAMAVEHSHLRDLVPNSNSAEFKPHETPQPLPVPSINQPLVAVPPRGVTVDEFRRAKLGSPEFPRTNPPIASLGTPHPMTNELAGDELPPSGEPEFEMEPHIEMEPSIELPPTNDGPPTLADELLSPPPASMASIPNGSVLPETLPRARVETRMAESTAGKLVPLPVLSVPARQNELYGTRGFSLDRSVAQKLFESLKSVLAIVGAIAIIFQFAKASLRKSS